MYMTRNVPTRIRVLLRKAMNTDKFWDDDEECERVHRIRRKVNARYPEKKGETVGKYSGLTRTELAKTGTCETDWF